MHRLCAILFTFAAVAQAQTEPTTRVGNFDARASLEEQVKKYPLVKVAHVEDAVRFDMAAENLALTTNVKPQDESPLRLEIADLDGINTLNIQTQRPDLPPFMIEFIHHVYAPDKLVITSAAATPGRVQVSRGEETATYTQNVDLLQSDQNAAAGEPRVTLYVQRIDEQTMETKVKLTLAADTVQQLRREHPDELMQYVEPIFRELHQEAALAGVDSRVAWQVFADAAKIDEKTADEVGKIVAEMDAQTFAQRENATKKLEKLGESAALVLMKTRRTNLSEEQKNRIETFLAAYRPLSDDEASARRNSPQFLIDCLYADDVQLRRLAVDQLAKVLKRRIDFDVNATRDQRFAAIRALRASLKPATRP